MEGGQESNGVLEGGFFVYLFIYFYVFYSMHLGEWLAFVCLKNDKDCTLLTDTADFTVSLGFKCYVTLEKHFYSSQKCADLLIFFKYWDNGFERSFYQIVGGKKSNGLHGVPNYNSFDRDFFFLFQLAVSLIRVGNVHFLIPLW